MISALLAFITALPQLVNGVNAFASSYFNNKARMTASRIGGDVAVVSAAMTAAGLEATARVEGLKVLASSKVLLFLVVGFAMPFMLYEWQCIVYDTLWMHGTVKTFPINENFAAWGQTIIVSLFGSGTAVTMAHMYFGRDKAGE